MKTILESVRVGYAKQIALAEEEQQDGSVKMKLASDLWVGPPWPLSSVRGTAIFSKNKLSGFESQRYSSFLTEWNGCFQHMCCTIDTSEHV